MRRLLCLLLLVLSLPAVGAGLLDSRPSATLGSALNNSSDFLPVHQAFQLNVSKTTPDAVVLQFVATDGYYLYRHRFQFKPTPADIKLGAPQIPDGEKKHDEYFGDVEVYHGIVEVTLPRDPADKRPFTLAVTYQGCADKGLCYPPETEKLAIDGGAPSTAANPAVAPAKDRDWGNLALYLLGGILLTFTPCVLPMLPILAAVVMRQHTSRLRRYSLALAYVLPMASCFALLGALMGMFGASLNLQARLQSAWVLGPFALFFALFAFSMFGGFELKLPAALSHRLDRIAGNTKGGSLWGAAVMGVLSSLLVSPCVSAPLAGVLIYISSTGDAVGGALKLFLLGLGMGIPLMVVAIGGSTWLPKSGPWLVIVKNIIGLMLLGVAIGLLSRVVPGPVTLLLVGLKAVGIGLFLGALEFVQKSARQRLAQLLGILLVFYGLACWWGALNGQGDPLHPLPAPATTVAGAPAAVSTWPTITTTAQLDQALAAAKQAGKPVVLDWYADWCISCKVIEHEVLSNPEVMTRLADYQKIRFDVTDSNAGQRALLDRYKLFGPPALMFFAANGDEINAAKVIGEIDTSGFLQKITVADGQRSP
ncbi:protein-disulfide reductase DsbD [Pseudomonas putida]